MTRQVRLLTMLFILALVLVPGGSVGAGPGQADDDSDPGRVLLVTVPGLTWADVDAHDLPVIEDFLADAAVANHAPRAARVRADPGGAYLTIGAGGRAVGHSSVDGQVLAVDDPAAGTPAGEIFERRTGVAPAGDWVLLNWPDIVERNDDQPYDVELGALADALADAGLSVAAIGNADGADTLADSFERQVGLAASTGDGVVADGELSEVLVVDGPEAAGRPFGRRVDVEDYLATFAELWEQPGRGVLVAEASDLARTMRYRERVDTDRYDELWSMALQEADELFGHLLSMVDPERDTVMLVAPYNLPGDRDLTVAAMADPARRPSSGGYLRSASTQRSGYVTLVDVAPTILDVLGVERPASMEGRPFEITGSGDSVSERVDHLVSGNAASRFRENLLVPTTLAIVVAIGVVSALAIACLARPAAPSWIANGVATAALVAMLAFPMSFLARAFPLEELGVGFYWLFVLASAGAIAVLAVAVGHRLGRPRLPLLIALAVVVAVPAYDVTNGSQLSLSAAFGYSPTGNSRLYGISNYALGAFAAAVSLLAGFVASRWDDRRGRLIAAGAMVAALAVIGVPVWGANVGGILSFSPVVVLFVVLLWQDRVRFGRLIVGFGAATLAAIAGFAALDLARPPDERAHLGRLMERISDEGVGILWGFIERKGLAAVEVSFSTFWSASVITAVVFLLYLRRVPGRPLAGLGERMNHFHAGLLAACAAAVFGSVANDSGTIVGGTAMLVVAASLVWLTLEPPRPVAARPESTEATP